MPGKDEEEGGKVELPEPKEKYMAVVVLVERNVDSQCRTRRSSSRRKDGK